MGRDDSCHVAQCDADWSLFPLIHSQIQPAHFCLNGQSANPETPKMAEPYFRLQIDGRFRIWKPKFLVAFHSNHRSMSLSFGDIRMWQTDRRTTRTIPIVGPHIVAGQLTRTSNIAMALQAKSNSSRLTLHTNIIQLNCGCGSTNLRAAVFLLPRSWPWPYDSETGLGYRYSQNVSAYLKRSCSVKLFECYSLKK